MAAYALSCTNNNNNHKCLRKRDIKKYKKRIKIK